MLGAPVYYKDIHDKFSQIYARTLFKIWKQSIQSVIERYSSHSSVYKEEDLLKPIDGIGQRHWELKNFTQEESVELTQKEDEFSEDKILLKNICIGSVMLSSWNFKEKNYRAKWTLVLWYVDLILQKRMVGDKEALQNKIYDRKWTTPHQYYEVGSRADWCGMLAQLTRNIERSCGNNA